MPAKTALERMAERAARTAEAQALNIAHVYPAERIAEWLRDATARRDGADPASRQYRTADREVALYRRAQALQAEGHAETWEAVADRAGIKRAR
jgi:hypothetical protein